MWVAPGTAAADNWSPDGTASDQAPVAGFVDQPKANATVTRGSPFRVTGWVVDTSAQGWSGIDDVRVFGGGPGNLGSQFGSGHVGEARPDVASALRNGYWNSSGFTVDVSGWDANPGNVFFSVYAHTPGRGWWSLALPLTAVDKPVVDVTAAANNCTAIGALIGRGVKVGVAPSKELVHIWLDSCAAAGMPATEPGFTSGVSSSASSFAPSVSTLAGASVQSTITNEFTGYEYDRIFVLDNGQIWQQTQYWTWYWYTYRPRALIYQSDSGWKLHVDDIDHDVSVQRIR
jgi:hypothetical protein